MVGGVALLILTALASLLINRPNPTPDLTTPSGVVSAYIQAIHAGQADKAWALLAPEAVQPSPNQPRPPYSKNQFEQEVQYAHRQTSSQVRITSVTLAGETATVQVEVTNISGDLFGTTYSSTVSVELRRQGRSWLITSEPSPYQFQ